MARGLGRELWPIILGRLVPQGKGKAKGVAREGPAENPLWNLNA